MKRTTSSVRLWVGLLALGVGMTGGCVDKTPPPLWPTPPPPTLAAPIGGWSERPARERPAVEPSATMEAAAPAEPRPDELGPWRPASPAPP